MKKLLYIIIVLFFLPLIFATSVGYGGLTEGRVVWEPETIGSTTTISGGSQWIVNESGGFLYNNTNTLFYNYSLLNESSETINWTNIAWTNVSNLFTEIQAILVDSTAAFSVTGDSGIPTIIVDTTDEKELVTIYGDLNVTDDFYVLDNKICNMSACFTLQELNATGSGSDKWIVNISNGFLYNSSDTFWYNDTLLNVTIDSKLTSVYYNATQSVAIAGTINGGTLVDTQHPDGNYDVVTFNFTEVAGSPGLDLRMNFTSVNDFNQGVMRYKTSSLVGDYPVIQMWDYDDSSWEDYPLVAESETFVTITQPVFDNADHLSGGIAQMRLYKAGNGNINNHYYVDWVAVIDGPGVPSGVEVDPFFKAENVSIWAEAQDKANATMWAEAIDNSNATIWAWLNQDVKTSASPEFQTLYLINQGGSGYNFKIKGVSTLADDVAELTFDTLNGNSKIVISGTSSQINQNVQTSASPTFAKVTTTGDMVCGDDLDVAGNVGIGVLASADPYLPLRIRFTRTNSYGGWYVKNLASDGITRFSVGMDETEGTFGVLFQNDRGDGRALVLNRNTTAGTFEIGTGGGYLKILTDGNMQEAQTYVNDIGSQRAVLMNSTGDFGYDSSSKIYKKNIVNISGEISSKIYDLRPVTYDKIGGANNQIGLIAEEVYELYPQFISYKREAIMGEVCLSPGDCSEEAVDYKLARNKTTGELIPETINYRNLVTPLIKEVQNLNERLKYLEDNCVLK